MSLASSINGITAAMMGQPNPMAPVAPSPTPAPTPAPQAQGKAHAWGWADMTPPAVPNAFMQQTQDMDPMMTMTPAPLSTLDDINFADPNTFASINSQLGPETGYDQTQVSLTAPAPSIADDTSQSAPSFGFGVLGSTTSDADLSGDPGIGTGTLAEAVSPTMGFSEAEAAATNEAAANLGFSDAGDLGGLGEGDGEGEGEGDGEGEGEGEGGGEGGEGGEGGW